MTFFIEEDVNLLRRIFLMGKMSKFLGTGWDSVPFRGFPTKVWGKGSVCTWWVQESNIEKGLFLVRSGIKGA